MVDWRSCGVEGVMKIFVYCCRCNALSQSSAYEMEIEDDCCSLPQSPHITRYDDAISGLSTQEHCRSGALYQGVIFGMDASRQKSMEAREFLE